MSPPVSRTLDTILELRPQLSVRRLSIIRDARRAIGTVRSVSPLPTAWLRQPPAVGIDEIGGSSAAGDERPHRLGVQEGENANLDLVGAIVGHERGETPRSR